jgi:hypothetical protein
MNPTRTTLLVVCLIMGPSLGSAADPSRGETLHASHCTSCHDSSVYTRENRRVTSLEGLRKQVQRCELSLGLKWFDEDLEAVTQYLNETYYRF